MLAIKCTDAGGLSPHQGRSWPLPVRAPDGSWTPGEWVESAHVARRGNPLRPGDVDRCAPAVYAALPDQVAEWVCEEAWIIELDDAVVGRTKIGARQGRLLRPIEGWTAEVLQRWTYETADRAIHVHAVGALRAVGFDEAAARLDATPPIVDARAAEGAAWAAEGAAWAARAAEAEMRYRSLRLCEMAGITLPLEDGSGSIWSEPGGAR